MIERKKIIVSLIITVSVCHTYALDGTFDRSFAQGQQLHQELPVCKAVANQSDGKMVVAGYVENQGKKTFAVARMLQNGMLDLSFGKNGVVQTIFSNGETASSAQAIMIDAQGRIVAGGFTNGINNNCHACLARYTTDGTLDKSFFGGRGIFKGTVITTFGPIEGMSQISALAETKEQKIVAVGSRYQNNKVCFALAQYESNGSLDLSFNPKGIASACGTVCTQFDLSNHDEACAVTLDMHGKLVVVGSSYASGVKTFALARYHKDGSLDQSFYAGNTRLPGTIITNFMCGETEGAARAVRVQSDGKIVAAGYTNAFCGGRDVTRFALARYTAQGMLDSSFGADTTAKLPGTVITSFGDERTRAGVNALLVQPDGKIVAGGFAEFANGTYFALARYDNTGLCDYTFNGGGAPSGKVLSRSSSHTNDEIFGLALVSPGDILAVGKSQVGAVSCGALARYMCDQDLEVPQITIPVDQQVIVNGSCVKVMGHAHSSSKIQIYLNDTLLDTVCVTRNNTWNCMLPPLADGTYYIQAIERFEAGNITLQSAKIKVTIDQHPVAINQTIECQGARQLHGSLVARGASGSYIYKIIKENNCNVMLMDANGSYKVISTIEQGMASFDFEVTDKITECTDKGHVDIIVREIPLAGSVMLETAQNKSIEASLESFTMGGLKPYTFALLGQPDDAGCKLNPDGSFVFMPVPDFVGFSEFKFCATDSYEVTSEPGHVTVQVHSVPKGSQYIDHAFVNSALHGKVDTLSFDGRKPYKYILLPDQNHCTVTMEENGSYICVPEKDYCGMISFEYAIIDGRGYQSEPCLVNIYLYEKVEVDQSLMRCYKNSKVAFDLNTLVTKGAKPYVFTLESTSDNATLCLNQDGVIECKPNRNFVGKIEFTVLVHQSNVPKKIIQSIAFTVEVTDLTEFSTTVVDVYEKEMFGNLNDNNKLDSNDFVLIYAPDGLNVTLESNGAFKLNIDADYQDCTDFLYTKNHLPDIYRALIILHQYPTAKSANLHVGRVSVVKGNLDELISGGIPPFNYKILSAKNGKIECADNGCYTFWPRFDLSENAEFNFVACDSRNKITNVATVKIISE